MLEIAMLIWGLVVLISGKTKRKGRELVGPKARISGLILMAPMPIALALFLGVAAATGQAIDSCVAIAIEASIVVACFVASNMYVTRALGPLELDLGVFNDSDSATGPAWRADPVGRHQYRYWDGASWTSHVSDNGQQSVDAFDEDRQTAVSSTGAASREADASADDPWASATCPHCGAVNEAGAFTCEGCGQPVLT